MSSYSSTSVALVVLCSHSLNSLYTVFPARAPQGDGVNCSLTDVELSLGVVCGDGRSPASQAGYQLTFLLSSLIISIAGGCIAG